MKSSTRGRITLRTAGAADAKKLYALIQANLEEGHLLPRTLGELTVHAERFVVAVKARKVVGCAELAPLSPHVAEVRSLAVDGSARGSRVGVAIVDELRRRARREGYEKLCAFTHAPRYFIHIGFSIVPHLWLTEKVFTDCVKCPQFRTCGQYAMVVPLDLAFDAERGFGLPAHGSADDLRQGYGGPPKLHAKADVDRRGASVPLS
ncbi:MAG TPA: GNAT family N-acetyltransferase [Vicinamibacterales bacterium]|jgi:amino-acid N-acetyltransferase|nr:GNAT family N-acetyltransferase [Vicinamibacterales bacterium]